jgi:hypothetical protein
MPTFDVQGRTMPTLSLAAAHRAALRLCDARHVSVRAGLYPQRTPHNGADSGSPPRRVGGTHEEDGRASGPGPSVHLGCPRAAVNSQ